ASQHPKLRDSASDGFQGSNHGSAAPSVGGMTTATDNRWGHVAPGTRVALAALGLGMALAVGFFIASRWMTNLASSETVPLPSAVAVSPPPAVELPEESPSVALPAPEVSAQHVDAADALDKSTDAQAQANH